MDRNDLDYGDALPPDTQYFPIGEPTQMQKDLGEYLSAVGPYSTPEDAHDALPFHNALTAVEQGPWDWNDTTYRVVGIDVGDILAPTPGGLVLDDYLSERAGDESASRKDKCLLVLRSSDSPLPSAGCEYDNTQERTRRPEQEQETLSSRSDDVGDARRSAGQRAAGLTAATGVEQVCTGERTTTPLAIPDVHCSALPPRASRIPEPRALRLDSPPPLDFEIAVAPHVA